MKITQIKAKIISNQKLSGNYWHLEFESGLIAKQAIAGQFVNIRVADGVAPLLRRPVSIFRVQGSGSRGRVEILYAVVGEGSRLLSFKKAGEYLDLVGPLGNGFNYLSLPSVSCPLIFVAGGLGVAPLFFLAEKLVTKSLSHQVISKILVLIGAKTKNHLLCADEFKKLGCVVKIATDDGSRGFKGKVTDLLKHQLSVIGHRSSVIYSCGPHLMLKAVAQIAGNHKIKAQFSLEKHMACGIGACLGCVVATKSGYKTVCKDGPVFSSEELVW